MLDKWHKKEKPVFTGIARGVGGFAFGGAAGAAAPTGIPLEATGGTKIPAASAPNGFQYHIFATTGATTLQVTSAGPSLQRMEVLVVAGGGGGGWRRSIGAGGVIHAPAAPVVVATMPVTVGAGGAGQSPSNGSPGSNSVFTHPLGTMTGYGGGGRAR